MAIVSPTMGIKRFPRSNILPSCGAQNRRTRHSPLPILTAAPSLARWFVHRTRSQALPGMTEEGGSLFVSTPSLLRPKETVWTGEKSPGKTGFFPGPFLTVFPVCCRKPVFQTRTTAAGIKRAKGERYRIKAKARYKQYHGAPAPKPQRKLDLFLKVALGAEGGVSRRRCSRTKKQHPQPGVLFLL